MIKITFLTDNYVDMPELKAEHGFSCFIEYDEYQILFDTGQTETMAQNMKVLFGELPKVDGIVLSHGHYDHTGGMRFSSDVLLNMSKDIYCHEHIFDQHLKKEVEGYSAVGIGEIHSQSFNFIQNSEKVEIFNNVYLSGSIDRQEPFDADVKLYAEIEGSCVKDPFRDEQYLIIDDNGLVIITGCSHSGIINIVAHAKTLFPDRKIKAVVGGFHLFRCDQAQMDRTVQFFKDEAIERIITGHCTGLNGVFALKESIGERVTPIKVGLKVCL